LPEAGTIAEGQAGGVPARGELVHVVACDPVKGEPGPAARAVEALHRPIEIAVEDDQDTFDDRYVIRAYVVHAPRLRGFALSMVRDPDAADDVVAEAFARLIGEVHAGRPPANAAAWLHRVCINLVVSGARRTTSFRRAIPRMAEVAASTPPEDVAERHDRDERVLLALAGMPLDARAALLLAADGHDSREIGAIIGRSPLATRAYLCRMRGRLHRASGC
jgi:RNA polymerase sigma-70 factor, ECF subfamily